MNSYLLKNAHLYINHQFENVDILIEDGMITKIEKNIESDIPTYDLKGKMVAHNFIDMHTHLREPGFEHKENNLQWNNECLVWWLWNCCGYGKYFTLYG